MSKQNIITITKNHLLRITYQQHLHHLTNNMGQAHCDAQLNNVLIFSAAYMRIIGQIFIYIC